MPPCGEVKHLPQYTPPPPRRPPRTSPRLASSSNQPGRPSAHFFMHTTCFGHMEMALGRAPWSGRVVAHTSSPSSSHVAERDVNSARVAAGSCSSSIHSCRLVSVCAHRLPPGRTSFIAIRVLWASGAGRGASFFLFILRWFIFCCQCVGLPKPPPPPPSSPPPPPTLSPASP